MVDKENWFDMSFNEIRKSINNADATLKVMTWNIHGATTKGYPNKRRSLVSIVLDISNPDVILLQEVQWVEKKMFTHLQLPFFDVVLLKKVVLLNSWSGKRRYMDGLMKNKCRSKKRTRKKC
ncbi:hypothetical protein BV898_19660 [Hypsibius exemplaris]|uniref:Endonuclease/exonuclease/phosphatase domain-containing protein n=1 Tax=Hypsibius exemplaris TaxID=2072580 RepID=A0A9X6NLA8_HYPEX|nr:hypothetical protein BV898_19660 [Hypsibius exemplaris]